MQQELMPKFGEFYPVRTIYGSSQSVMKRAIFKTPDLDSAFCPRILLDGLVRGFIVLVTMGFTKISLVWAAPVELSELKISTVEWVDGDCDQLDSALREFMVQTQKSHQSIYDYISYLGTSYSTWYSDMGWVVENENFWAKGYFEFLTTSRSRLGAAADAIYDESYSFEGQIESIKEKVNVCLGEAPAVISLIDQFASMNSVYLGGLSGFLTDGQILLERTSSEWRTLEGIMVDRGNIFFEVLKAESNVYAAALPFVASSSGYVVMRLQRAIDQLKSPDNFLAPGTLDQSRP